MSRRALIYGLVAAGVSIISYKVFRFFLDDPNRINFVSFAEAHSRDNGQNCFLTYFPETGESKRQCSDIMKYGLPGNENILFRDRFIISYSYKYKQAQWSLEKLSIDEKKSFNPELDRNKCNFARDPNIPHFFSASNEDYRNSGYDRGHMAAAGNHKVQQESLCQTFMLSNISPQIGKGFNQNIWEQLELHSRQMLDVYKEVFICTGILFLPKQDTEGGEKYVHYRVIGDNNVAVPTHYFKVILGVKKNTFEVQNFIIPNESIPDNISLESFRVRLSDIEQNAGLIFFQKINRRDLTEVFPKIRASRRAISKDKKRIT